MTTLLVNAQIFINTNNQTEKAEEEINKVEEKVINSTTTVTGTTISGTPVNETSKDNTTTHHTSPSSTLIASGADVPPNAEPGKCYARCQTEDQYTFTSKQVINTPKIVKKVELPALYVTVYDTVVTKPARIKSETIPAVYETVKEQKMVAPATTKWVKGKADAGCLSADPEDCQVMCLVEVPAQYKTISKRVMKSEAYTKTIQIPMEYKIVAKQVKVKDVSYAEQIIPATYKTVQERVLLRKGGYQGWKEILCNSELTSQKIMSIQRALLAAGFNPGPIDNIFGAKTKEALVAYQRAKGLPVGNLNIETLKSLGVQ